MKSNMKKIAFAISALSLAPSAFAAPINLTTGVPTGNIIYVGGASAQTPSLGKALVKMCNSSTGNLKTYLDYQDGKQAFVYTCDKATTASPFGLDNKFVVVKTDAGGSFAGLKPIILRGTNTLRFPTLTDADTVTTMTNTAVVVGTLGGQVSWSDGSSVAGLPAAGELRIPDVALSDVSLALFKNRGNSIGSTANYTVKGASAGQGFGVIVSPSLYTALQTDQGINAGTCVTSTGACQPSISKSQYASVISGAKGLLQGLLPNTNVTSSQTLRISRRSSTSGTTAATDAYFLNQPCNAATASVMGGAITSKESTFTDSTAAGGLGTVVTVALESTTGNVTNNVKNATGFALGVVSLENLEADFSPAKFVKINGVSPNYYLGAADTTQKKTAVNGLYDFAYETHMIYSNQANVTNSKVSTFAESLRDKLADGSDLVSTYGVWGDPSAVGKAAFGGTGNSPTSQHTGNFSRGQNECAPLSYKY